MLPSMIESEVNFLRGNRQIADLDSNGIINGIGDGGSSWSTSVFADGLALKRTRSSRIVNVDCLQSRNVTYCGNLILSQIGGNDPSLTVLQMFHDGKAQPLNQPALDLSLMHNGIDDRSNVIDRCHLQDCELSRIGIDFDFRELREKGQCACPLSSDEMPHFY